MDYMHRVYSNDPPLPHVEFGRVIASTFIGPNHERIWSNECLITRMGYQLTVSNMTIHNLSKEDVINQIRQALYELHGIGFAHCDIAVRNVLIDDDGTVFLSDLEYLTPIGDPQPHEVPTRLPQGVDPSTVTTALELDGYQFESFRREVYHL